MNRGLPFFGALAICGVLGAIAGACGGSNNNNNNATDAGGGNDASGNPACAAAVADPTSVDPLHPPVPCSPTDLSDAKCSKQTAVSSCPQGSTGNGCMAQAPQSGTVANLRMGRIELYYPSSLSSVAAAAVDPAVQSDCEDGGTAQFNWLLQIDLSKNQLTTGGAHFAADKKTYQFATDVVTSKGVGDICPGFVGGAPITLAPVTVPIHMSGKSFSTDVFDKIYVPIFDPKASTPIILPLSQARLQDVTLSDDHNCIGAWDPNYYCGSSKGWTTGGAVVAAITVAEADSIPLKDAGCQSLCSLLVSDASKTVKDAAGHSRCKPNTDGTFPAYGDTKVKTAGDAFRLSATFGAYGVAITGIAPPADGGVSDTGGSDGGASDSGASDSGASEAGATDAAAGG